MPYFDKNCVTVLCESRTFYDLLLFYQTRFILKLLKTFEE